MAVPASMRFNNFILIRSSALIAALAFPSVLCRRFFHLKICQKNGNSMRK